jgi:endo-1,4-beta-xylanase
MRRRHALAVVLALMAAAFVVVATRPTVSRAATPNMDYNGRVAAGQFIEFGFQSSGTGSGLTPSCAAS